MSRKLNIDAVAEGVETREDWDMLLLIGRGMAQGCLMAAPMEGAAFVPCLRDWKGLL